MIVALDVDYRDSEVVAAGVGCASWTSGESLIEIVVTSDAPPAPYEPGRFYLRELPHLRSVLALLSPRDPAAPIEAIIVDGYVWLGADKGLGAHLYDALGATIPVIGVAKTQFASATAIEVIRGQSARPLYVTAVGIDAAIASQHVLAMHGEHRIPTLLKRVDSLARAV
ncbi:MAG TPA: endonuclease V [Kofleriaceae bacterium]